MQKSVSPLVAMVSVWRHTSHQSFHRLQLALTKPLKRPLDVELLGCLRNAGVFFQLQNVDIGSLFCVAIKKSGLLKYVNAV